jgi:hypothetical protein
MAGPVRAPDSVSAPAADPRLGWRAALISYASYVAGVALATWLLAAPSWPGPSATMDRGSSAPMPSPRSGVSG